MLTLLVVQQDQPNLSVPAVHANETQWLTENEDSDPRAVFLSRTRVSD
jgi:hypothetical protein